MKEKGMGRTRLGRLAAVTIPATAVTVGFGVAIIQGAVTAQLSATDAFKVKGASATATGLELSMRGASVAASQSDGDPANAVQKKSALVTLANGKVTDLKLCADQPLPAPLGVLGLTVSAVGEVNLGTSVDLSADAVKAGVATLPSTEIGVAQSQLDHQSTVAQGYNAGGFGLESTGAVNLAGLDADAYGLTLGGVTLNNLNITPQLGSAESNC